MNRERLLFVVVIAILGLWWFVLRSPEKPVTHAKSREEAIARRTIKSESYETRMLSGAKAEPWTEFTNVRPHPRPVDSLVKPKAFDLPNIWPPTSRSVSTDRLALLRRNAAAPTADDPKIVLPTVGGGGGGAADEEEDRIDSWQSKGVGQKGRVREIFVTGAGWLKEPPKPWPFGAGVLANNKAARFLRNLVRLETDPPGAQQDGVKEVHAVAGRLTFRQKFPDEINSFHIAIAGKDKGYFDALKAYLPVAQGNAFQPRIQAGLQLLQAGLAAKSPQHRDDLLKWSLEILEEARQRVPEGEQATRRQILLAMLQAAGALNRYEQVLELAEDHLNAFPGESEVLERVGDVLASRTFSLTPFAVKWYRLASDRASAQRRLIAALVSEGRFEEAQTLIASGMAGPAGAEQDLLRARVALALGEFQAAKGFADRHTGGDFAAEAHQILGGIAYAMGDAETAATEFEEAAKADPGRSTAFSDWGLALAVQGKAKDALLCFERALELDRIDNAVVPQLGRGYLMLTAAEAALRAAAAAEDAAREEPRSATEKLEEAKSLRESARDEFAAAVELFKSLQENYRADLLVRYMLAYAKERTGNLEEAADLYRATIDGDPRYRVAIARLGLVQAQRVLDGGPKDLAPAAIAHLSKAVEQSEKEVILPYLLARFLMTTAAQEGGAERPQRLALADRMFERAAELKGQGDLPLWADLGRACLAYADEKRDVLDAMALLNTLLERVKEAQGGFKKPEELMKNEVYRAATINLQIIEDNERKVDRSWDFTALSKKPSEWDGGIAKSPMEMLWVPGKGLVFSGTANYGGQKRDAKVVLDACSVDYAKDDMTGGGFWELELTGVVPPASGDPAELGIGVVTVRNDQFQGLMIKRKRTGNVEIKLEGGERQMFKDARGNFWVELQNVPWPTGEFRLKIEVMAEYGQVERAGDRGKRRQGRFRVFLNDEEIFLKEFGDYEGEKTTLFSPSRATQSARLYLWAEGRDGTKINGIQVSSVLLTLEKK